MNSSSWGPGTRVAVVGAAATGLAVAQVLGRRGVEVVCLERRPLDSLPDSSRREWAALGPAVRLESTQDLPAGVDVVVPSPGVRASAPPVAEALRRGIPVVSEIEVAWSISRAPVLAVTGTNGKTTTVAMLGKMMEASGRRGWVCGNMAADHGERLPMICAAETAAPDDVLVAEVSSFQLEWVREFRPRGAAWLNLSADHGDAYPDMEAYAAAKRRILECQSPDDVAVLNASDAWIRGSESGAGSGRRVWFDGANPVFPESWDIEVSLLPLRGVHQRANALAAGLLASDWGVGPAAIRSALESFELVAHRMEVVGHFEGIEWINNSMCTNVAAVDASLAALASAPVAIVGGRSKETDLMSLAGVVARRSRACVAIGEVAVELAGMLDQLGHVARIAGSMDDAVAMAGELARRGDVVVLSPGCSSFDMFSGFEERGRAFRDAVARWSAR